MNIKLQTNEQLSATVANGLAGVFVNGVSLSASLSNASGKVYFDNRISGVTGSNDLSVVKLSADEYAQMLDGGTCLSNAIYIVEAPNIDAFKQRIINVAPPTDLSDAATKGYVDNAVATKSTVSFNRITTSGTNIGSITIDGTTTQIFAPSGGGGSGSSVQVSADYSTGTRVATISVDSVPTSIYVPNRGGGGSSVQVSADYSTGTRVATISVDSVPTPIYVPNSSGGSSRYALETAQLVADSGSLTCTVNDQAITTIQVSSSTTPVVVQLPAQPEDGARDFILRIEISSSTAPTFTFNGVNETIDFDSEDDDWAVMEPGLNLVSFTETKRGN